MIFSQTTPLNINVLKDHSEFTEIIYESKKMGALFLGGGVPKHFIMNGSQLHDGLSYAIQITMDRSETGSLGGAPLEEAKSWAKARAGSSLVTVIGDATIIFPLMVAGAKEIM